MEFSRPVSHFTKTKTKQHGKRERERERKGKENHKFKIPFPFASFSQQTNRTKLQSQVFAQNMWSNEVIKHQFLQPHSNNSYTHYQPPPATGPTPKRPSTHFRNNQPHTHFWSFDIIENKNQKRTHTHIFIKSKKKPKRNPNSVKEQVTKTQKKKHEKKKKVLTNKRTGKKNAGKRWSGTYRSLNSETKNGKRFLENKEEEGRRGTEQSKAEGEESKERWLCTHAFVKKKTSATDLCVPPSNYLNIFPSLDFSLLFCWTHHYNPCKKRPV